MDYARRLIEDALLVSSFAHKSGKVDDDLLLIAIRNLEAALSDDTVPAEAVELQKELRTTLRAIQPVTLIDLRNGFDPFQRKASDRASWRDGENLTKWVFVSIALTLAFLCAYYTSWQSQTDRLLVAVSTLESERQSAQFDEVVLRAYGGEAAFPLTKSDPARADAALALQQRLNSLRQYDDKLESLVNISSGLYQNVNAFVALWYKIKTSFIQYGNPAAQNAGDCIYLSTKPQVAGNNISDDQLGFESLIVAIKTLTQSQTELRCQLKMGFSDFLYLQNRIQEYVTELRLLYPIVTQWLLPSLYGAFGAMIYFMRVFINPLYPNSSFSTVMLRVILGAFTGIFVVWFTSSSGINPAGTLNLSFGSLFLAFIFGFSIDVFYGVLDNLARSVGDSITKIGSRSKSG